MHKYVLLMSSLLFLACSSSLRGQESLPMYDEYRLLVVFADQLTDSEVRDKIRVISTRYDVISYRKLSRSDKTQEEIEAQYPERSKRIPESAASDKRPNVYVLTVFHEQGKLEEIIKDLEAFPGIKAVQQERQIEAL